MRPLAPIPFGLLAAVLLPVAAKASDAAGCTDLKPLPRLEGCVIVECSAKRHDHDPFDAADGSGAPADADTNALSYSCPLADLRKMKRDFAVQLRNAGYQNVNEDTSDAASPALTARKGSQWIHWDANTEDGAVTYTLTAASGAGEKFKAEACGQPPLLSSLKQCEVVECNSKSEDSVAMRTAQKEETPLAGNVQTVTLACPSISPAQAFSTVETELRTAGFEILFSDRENPESGWMTGRAGRRWAEFVSTPDGESMSYAFTLVPSAEVLTAVQPEPKEPKETKEPKNNAPAPQPTPVQSAAAPAVRIPAPAPEVPPAAPVSAIAAAVPVAVFIPPKPILQVPIEATEDRILSVRGDVAIDMLVDVSADGFVTKAELTGKVTSNVLKLKSAALEAVSHWRFEPARQDGRIVPAVKIGVRMHFRGRPWLF